jgi:lipopolysaccharide/colanic/teichoic acid biosynthesis glycosyltransferase
MTGWAQIHFAETGSSEEAIKRLEYDLYYVKNVCASLDFSIMVRWLKRALRFLG